MDFVQGNDLSFSPKQVRIARIFNTYGPRMCIDDGRVVSNFVAQVCVSVTVILWLKLVVLGGHLDNLIVRMLFAV